MNIEFVFILSMNICCSWNSTIINVSDLLNSRVTSHNN